jgi:hypothetical protein
VHLPGGFGKTLPHRRRQVDQLKPLIIQPDLRQQFLRVCYSPSGIEITFQVMAIALQSTRDHHPVCTVLECTQHVQHVELAGAR